ncbi:undecaprenyl-phosphate glucose phosphotransferase [Pseudobacteriovorax antillogorgiicola]|uniref:Undecaprenyl-phosphate glucose phosphotransferase n=1 Tax=Pseudobacteriovorax antillogorgiicola TaxID=1513793 RepID=A0A1Y6C5S2_9BACT|nr:undecaprenyl-phosphate glucose phosphotransferase [Pseudobacteriovorax antillogorgiicola]TCS49403.1 Undecaprenyl-phosphate glucose phosphotransferase [Pseudobacteriovorax antillogorgiicola]SMF47040.1 Undecaprenyl-phosphate glucose phosphotransferase [Pseudobacteriovorax antillogorgiicola]
MKSRSSYIFSLFFIGFDLISLVLAWICAFYIRFYTVFDSPLGIPASSLYFKLIPFILAIWILVTTLGGMYRRIGLHQSRLGYLADMVQSSVYFVLGLIAFNYFYEEYRYSRLTLLIFSLVLPLFLIIGRKQAATLSRYYRVRQRKKKVLLLASGRGLQSFISSGHFRYDSELIGIMIPDHPSQQEDLDFCQKHGFQTFPPCRHHWADFFMTHPCESVVVALPHSQYQYLEDHLDQISDQVADIKIIPDVLKYTRFNTGIDMMGNTPVIHIHDSPLTGFNCLVKRTTDILGAAIALLIFAPVMVAIAILVPLSSRGPILYRQKRMGLDGRTFDCLKFRSMPVDAEAQTGAVWAKAGDNRATPFGSFLRRTSLDELPQLLNVIRGDMSLVGPRPERPIFVNEFRKEVPGYMLRHKVKTGITGWAQVNGWRGSTSIEKRIECDLYYIQNWSFWLDVKILFMTVEEVLIGRNAY